MIVVPELVYTGEALDVSGIKIDASKTSTGTYFNQTFTVKASAEGWTHTIDPSEVKAAGGLYRDLLQRGAYVHQQDLYRGEVQHGFNE